MKTKPLLTLAVILPLAAINVAEAQTTNSWIGTNGLWQTGANWSLGVAPTNTHALILITNAATKTVTIDAATPAGNLTISNLIITGVAGAINRLSITNTGSTTPLRILNQATISAGGEWIVTNGAVAFDRATAGGRITVNGQLLLTDSIVSNNLALTVALPNGNTGSVWLSGGTLVSTNGSTAIGSAGVGQMQVSNGTWITASVNVGLSTGSQGTLTIAGGTNVLAGPATLIIGGLGGSSGTVWVTGGQLTQTNNVVNIIVGDSGVGRMTVSNGTVQVGANFIVGGNAGSRGTLTVAGGTNVVGSSIDIGNNAGATGAVWVTVGQLTLTNGSAAVGNGGVGQMTVSNGTVRALSAIVGNLAGSQGTLTVAGGTNSIFSSLMLGTLNCAATGIVNVTGGSLFVTNAADTAVLEVRSGSVTLSSGTLVIDQLILTNACGRFRHTGGTLSITTTNLPPGLDADGDGFLNGSDPDPFNPDDDGDGLPGDWEVTYGFDPLDPTGVNGAAGDPDGDGLSNLAEYLVGTDPTVPSPNPNANSWTFNNSSIWDMNSRWSLGTPSLSNPANWITNASTKTVTLASSAQTSSLTITNLGVQGFGAGTNTLLVTTTNTLVILNHFAVGTNAIVIVSNSNLRVNGLLGGKFLVSGTTTLQGSTSTVSSALEIGTGDCTATGTVVVAGGSLLVTNAAATAVLEVRSGTLTFNSGTLKIDKFVMTNACGRFLRTGGSLSITTTNITAGLDADGDGLPNSWETTYGLSPFDKTGNNGASGDHDGDGFTNLQEFIAGTNPNDAGSVPGGIWTNAASGKWEVGANWLLTTPPASNQSVFITNSASKVVTIDAVTTNTPATMIITNLTVAGPAGTINTLQLSDAGTNVPLRILNTATINSGGALLVTNSTVRVEGGALTVNAATDDASLTVLSNGAVAVVGPVTIGGGVNSTGLVSVTSGRLVVTNNPALVSAGDPGPSGLVIDGSIIVTNGSSISNLGITIGYSGSGSLTVHGGTMMDVGLDVGFSGRGTFTMNAGTISVSSTLVVGYFSTGAVWMTDGQLTITNTSTSWIVGDLSVGEMTVSNGTWLSRLGHVGFQSGSQGTLTIAGGTNALLSDLFIATSGYATGAVWVTGGQLSNRSAFLGFGGVGQMTVSNGTWLAQRVIVASNALAHGTLTIAGGTSSVFSNLTIGSFPCTPTGTVVVAGGNLFVTNATTSAVLEVRTGSLILNSGVLTINKLVMTNACGTFVHTGGTLVYGTAILDPTRDDDGDGISNSYEQGHGLDPLNAADATLDNDGDGQSNLAEFQAGTDATNSASSFQITAITKEANDIRVTWMMGPDKTNALESTAGDGSGGFATNNFADIFTVTDTVGTATNYLDLGAATNSPTRYYRIRLVP